MTESLRKSALEEYYSRNEPHFIEGLSKLLAIPSVSTDSAYKDSCEACVDWLVSELSRLGAKAEKLPLTTHNGVYAEFAGDPSKPTVLFYGHYDVQPVDPVALWHTEPFTATVKDGRIYARGSEDNKGQLWYVIKAIEALHDLQIAHGPIKILLEGEEENGSHGLTETLPSLKEKLAADILLVCDTGTHRADLPVIVMGLRGTSHVEFVVKGPHKDLHSGVHGGLVKNPATELCRLVASFHNQDGSVAVPGFYDGIVSPTAEDLRLANEHPIPDEAYIALVGAPPVGGEKGYSWCERRGFRPTLEVNGIYGGYQGEGSKTIIPSYAGVKISCRLVRGQEPTKIIDAVIAHAKAHVPFGCTVEVVSHGATGGMIQVSASSPSIQRATRALEAIFGGKPGYMWEGASIPVIAHLSETVGREPVLVGFGLEEDNIHAPNESFALEQFRRGFLFAGLFLSE